MAGRVITIAQQKGGAGKTTLAAHLAAAWAGALLITRARVLKVIRLAHEACRGLGMERPRIGVAGLNPHAGDGGSTPAGRAREGSPASGANTPGAIRMSRSRHRQRRSLRVCRSNQANSMGPMSRMIRLRKRHLKEHERKRAGREG